MAKRKTNKEAGATAVAEPKTRTRQDLLPPYNLILHNDPVNTLEFVHKRVMELTRLEEQDALQKCIEAHKNNVAILLTTHKERGELLVDQFMSSKITTSLEQA